MDTDDATREQIQEALTNMARTASRMPDHWVDRKAAIHSQIDRLLDQLESAVD